MTESAQFDLIELYHCNLIGVLFAQFDGVEFLL